MKLNLTSWQSDTDSTKTFSPNYEAYLMHPNDLRMAGSANFTEVAGTWAKYTGKKFGGKYLEVLFVYQGAYADVHLREDEMRRWFNTFDETPYKLLAEDSADLVVPDREWYVMATPVSLSQNDNSSIVLFALEEPYWRVNTASTDTWAISSGTDTLAVDCIGELASPIFRMTPGTAKSGNTYKHKRFIEIIPQSTTKVLGNHPVLLTTLNTAALVSGGKANSDGSDWRFMVANVEYPYFFGSGSYAFNQATTKIWSSLDINPLISMTLKTAIAGSGEITEIEFEKTLANKKMLQKLPPVGILRIKSGSNTEYFTYVGKSVSGYKVRRVQRHAKDSSMYAHSAGVTVIYLQFDAWFYHGNAGAVAPVYDNTRKPALDLDASTNTSWVCEIFKEDGIARPGAWVPALLTSTTKRSATYTGTHNTVENPATAAGLKMATKAVNGVERSETAALLWLMNCPAGITTVTIGGEKYRASNDWPTVELLKSLDGVTYANASTIATPTAKAAWQAITISALSMGGSYPYIQFKMSGTLAAATGNRAYAEMLSYTLAIDSGSVPLVTVQAEGTTYYLDTTITNNTTGDAITVTWPMKIGETITVDCDARTVTYEDGSRVQAAIELSDDDRTEWLDLVYGTNTLAWSDSGTTDMTVEIEWADRVSA